MRSCRRHPWGGRRGEGTWRVRHCSGGTRRGPGHAYRILGVRLGATREEVKARYRVLAKEHHPDAAGGGCAARMQEINSAYEEIVNCAPSSSSPDPWQDLRRVWREKQEANRGPAADFFRDRHQGQGQGGYRRTQFKDDPETEEEAARQAFGENFRNRRWWAEEEVSFAEKRKRQQALEKVARRGGRDIRNRIVLGVGAADGSVRF
eukprot:Hpha_TRINITY_DN8579_c0_g1::TRINITY_DN8579_c0_g1_i1::g.146571::m.146571